MKIVFFGDSITDMNYDRNADKKTPFSLCFGYPFVVSSNLSRIDPTKHEIVNRGIGGNRIVDLYARIKSDVWNEKPDVLSILIGINDVWHEICNNNGVETDRFEKVYSMIIEDTLKVLPGVRIILMEPFVLKGKATENAYDRFLEVKEYAKIVREIAEKYDLDFVPLQERFDEMSEKFCVEPYLYDGVHPGVAGATLIADEWVKYFKEHCER